MNEILVFSDLHANKHALKEIAQKIKNVDVSIFCGDILGYGKDIEYCIDYILNNVDLIVLGNHDRLAITDENLEGQLPLVRDSIIFTRNRLSNVQKEKISSLPLEIWHNDIYVTHSINDEYLRNNSDFKRLYSRAHKQTKYVFFGHTHEQVLFKYNKKFIINPGSITKGRRSFPRSYVIINDEGIKFFNLGELF